MFSYWEKEYYNFKDSTIIIGGGIVGLSAALSLKTTNLSHPVIVLEKNWPPHGASTKNAGFVCFGSFSETLADIKVMSESEVIEIIKMRWEGVSLLQERIGSESINYTGGYEVFDKGSFPTNSEIKLVNELFLKAIGVKDYMKPIHNTTFSQFDDRMMSLPSEGMLQPMQMISKLKSLCEQKGILFLTGHEVSAINKKSKTLTLQNHSILPYNKCVVCTNGFAPKLFPDLPLKAVRNQVLMTNPIDNLTWEGVFHYNEGFYYFRNHGKRILIGGARNLDVVTETTDQFGFNEKIRAHLKEFLSSNVMETMDFKIEAEWSGILGVGPSKKPIIQKIATGLYVGVRLGGMGVAIGSYLGKELAELVLKGEK